MLRLEQHCKLAASSGPAGHTLVNHSDSSFHADTTTRTSNTPMSPTSRASPASTNHATSAPRFTVTALQTSPPAMRRSRPRPSAPAPEPSFYAIGPGRTRTGGRGRPSGFGRARGWAQPWGGRSVRVVERRRRQGACGAAWWLGRCTAGGSRIAGLLTGGRCCSIYNVHTGTRSMNRKRRAKDK
jgi:hypothetical protein